MLSYLSKPVTNQLTRMVSRARIEAAVDDIAFQQKGCSKKTRWPKTPATKSPFGFLPVKLREDLRSHSGPVLHQLYEPP